MRQKVVRSTVIDAPIARVWAVLRDFNSHDQWHTVVDQSRIEADESSAQVGCVRNFTLKDGNHIREQLLALSDTEYQSTYTIVEATVPLLRYVATVTLKPVTDGDRTFWHWESTFETPPGQERELRDMVAQGVYEAGFENLRRFLGASAVPASHSVAPAPPSVIPAPPSVIPAPPSVIPAPPSVIPAPPSVIPAPPSVIPAKAGTQGVPAHEVRLSRYGGPEELELVPIQLPPPGPGEVRIRQAAIGVNFLDIYLRRGWMPGLLLLPGVPGMEAAGTVDAVGPGVTQLRPGERVAYLSPEPGAYRSMRNVDAQRVLPLPPDVPDTTAAALLLKGLTADYLLRDLGHVRAGMRVLVHAAAGGVGSLVCAWARHLGAQVVGTVSSEAKAQWARARGCPHVIVSADGRFADAVHAHCGGADLVIDGLGAAAMEENLAALDRCGHWVSLGQASGFLPPIDPERLLARSLTFSRPVVFDYVARRRQLEERAARLWQALREGVLPPPAIERFALGAAGTAHQRLESRASTGALVLVAG